MTEQLTCAKCGKTTRHLRFSKLFQMAAVSALVALRAKRGGAGKPLGALLRELDSDERPCDKDAEGCGHVQALTKRLRICPDVFTLMLASPSAPAPPPAVLTPALHRSHLVCCLRPTAADQGCAARIAHCIVPEGWPTCWMVLAR